MKKLIVCLAALGLLGAWDLFKSPDPRVKRGNDSFARGAYEEALKAYEEARQALPEDPGVAYDHGAALYQKGLHAPDAERDGILEEAGKSFASAAQAKDPKLAAQAQNGLGSSLFRRGKYAPAVQELKKGLRMDPENRDIRHNLELALRKKKEEEQQKQQQQQQQQQQKQDPQKQDPQKQDPQQQSQQDPQKQDQQQQSQQDQQKQDQQQQSQQDQQKQDQQQQDQQKQQQDPQKQDQQSQQQQQQDQQQQDQQAQANEEKKDKDGDKPQDGEPQQGKEAKEPPRREVDRKLDALERRSRAVQMRKLRSRAQEGRLARPSQDW